MVFHSVSLGVRLLFLLLVGIAVEGVRQQGWEGWLALPAVALVSIAQFQNELRILHIRTVWFPFGAQVSLATIASLLLVAAISVLLRRRLVLSLRQQREMALDVKQAQEVQQVLIPMALPHVPGLAIESEYRPAREVGGAIRTAARYDPYPLAVLNELNQRLCRRGHTHATCLALRIAAMVR